MKVKQNFTLVFKHGYVFYNEFHNHFLIIYVNMTSSQQKIKQIDYPFI